MGVTLLSRSAHFLVIFRGVFVKRFTSVKPQRDLGGLQLASFGRGVGCSVTGSRDQKHVRLWAGRPFAVLADGGFEALQRVEVEVLSHGGTCHRVDQRSDGVVLAEVGCHDARRLFYLGSLIEARQEAGQQCPWIGLGVICRPGQMGRGNIEEAVVVDRDRAVHHPTDQVWGGTAAQHLVHGITVSKGV